MRPGKLYIWKCADDCCGTSSLHWRAGRAKHKPFAHFISYERAVHYFRTVWSS